MTTIQPDLLATVTGGARQQCAPQAQQQQQGGDDQQQAGADQQGAGGGGLLAGLDGFLSFLQSSNFGQIIGGLRGILGTFASQGQGSQASQPQQQDAS